MKVYLVMYRWDDYDGNGQDIEIFSNLLAAEKYVEELEKYVEELEAEAFEQSKESWKNRQDIPLPCQVILGGQRLEGLEAYHHYLTRHSCEIVEMEVRD